MQFLGDTHIWVWWIDENIRLKDWQARFITENKNAGLGVSIISCWEVAKLVEHERLKFACSLDDWIENALSYSGIRLIELTPEIVQTSKCPKDNFYDMQYILTTCFD